MTDLAEAGSEASFDSQPALRARQAWQARYIAVAVAVDALMALIAAEGARLIRFGFADADLVVGGVAVPYSLIVVVAVPVWAATMALGRTYDARVVGAGNDEYRRILNAGLFLLAAVSVLHFMFRLELARGFVAAFLPLGIVLTVMGRFLLRKRLHASRLHGQNCSRVLVVGGPGAVERIATHLAAEQWAGFDVVAVCSTAPNEPHLAGDDLLRVAGGVGDTTRVIDEYDVDTLIIADPAVFADGELRALVWQLEGRGIHLIVAPAVTEVAGPRIITRPVAGLPLVHVEEPRFSVSARIYKAVFDRIAAGVGLLVAAPLLLLCAVAIKLTSRGPVLYRQTRVGLDGQHFTFLKFRTMVCGADELRDALADANESDVMFKIRRDPRVTPLGRVLRRTSLDELPQLFHVLSGKMSLVGPRPPLPCEVEAYEQHVHRRFLVKPGLTGLWQVNGRSDLCWDDAVRLDLHYVDHWSPTMDVAILLKTVTAVISGRGAY